MPSSRKDRITITKLEPPRNYRHIKKQHNNGEPTQEEYNAVFGAPLMADDDDGTRVGVEKRSDSEEDGHNKTNIVDVDDLIGRNKVFHETDINELQRSIQSAFARSTSSSAVSPITQTTSDDGLAFDEIIKDLTIDEEYDTEETASRSKDKRTDSESTPQREVSVAEEEETAATTKDYFGDNDDTKDIDNSTTGGFSESLKTAEVLTPDQRTEAESKLGGKEGEQKDSGEAADVSVFSPCTTWLCSSDVTIESLQNLKEEYGVHLQLDDLKDHFVEDMEMGQLVTDMKGLQSDLFQMNMSQLLEHLGLPSAEDTNTSTSISASQKLLLPSAAEGNGSSNTKSEGRPQSSFTCITGADQSPCVAVFHEEEEGLEIPYLSCQDVDDIVDLKKKSLSKSNKGSNVKSTLFGLLPKMNRESPKNMKVLRIQLSDGTMATVSQKTANQLRKCNWV